MVERVARDVGRTRLLNNVAKIERGVMRQALV